VDPQSEENGYTPAGPPAPYTTPHRSIFSRRWPKVVGALGALTLTAALGLQFSDASHPAAKPTAKVAAPLEGAVQPAAQSLELPVDSSGDTTTGGSSSSSGGIHGSFSLYDGVGGGLEFWFDPDTGQLTVAIGAGVGEGGDGVVGYYVPGTVPEPGPSDFVEANFGVGTVGTVNVTGEYEWESGNFSGSISATVDGRTVYLNSDGSGGLDVSVQAEEGAEGFEGAVGVKYVFSFDVSGILQILQDIWDALTSVDDEDPFYDEYYDDDGESDDVTGTDTTVTDDDGTTDDSTTDGTDDSGDDGDSASSGGGGGGDGGSCDGDDDDDDDDEEAAITPQEIEPCSPAPDSLVLTVHADHGITVSKAGKAPATAGR
jgi:hypothetical protein